METAIPGIPTAPPANVDNTPAVQTPDPTPGTSPEARLEAIKARVKQAQGIAPPPKKPDAESKPDDKPIEAKPEDQQPETDLKVPAKVLKELGRLQSRVRELEPISKQFEAIKSDAELTKELKKLWGGTHEDKVAALAKISGKDGLDELAAIVHAYYKTEQESDQPARDPELKKLTDLIEAQDKKIAALLEERTKEKETASKADSDKENQRANEFVSGMVAANKTKFELCARPENKTEAVDLIQSAAIKMIEGRIEGYDSMNEKQKTAAFAEEIKLLDAKTTEGIYLSAMSEVESEFEATGKRFSKATQTARPAFDPDRYASFVRPLSKPAITVTAEELSKDPKTRFEQIRQRAIEKAEAGLYRR